MWQQVFVPSDGPAWRPRTWPYFRRTTLGESQLLWGNHFENERTGWGDSPRTCQQEILYSYEIQKHTTKWGSKNAFNTISSSESIQSQVLNLRVSRPLDWKSAKSLCSSCSIRPGTRSLGWRDTPHCVGTPVRICPEGSQDPIVSDRCPLDQYDICKWSEDLSNHQCEIFHPPQHWHLRIA
jgi:hypothetical protein